MLECWSVADAKLHYCIFPIIQYSTTPLSHYFLDDLQVSKLFLFYEQLMRGSSRVRETVFFQGTI